MCHMALLSFSSYLQFYFTMSFPFCDLKDFLVHWNYFMLNFVQLTAIINVRCLDNSSEIKTITFFNIVCN